MTAKLKFVHLSDFTGGLQTYNPPAELALNESPDCDNIFLSNKGFFKRNGDSLLNASPMNGGVAVQGLQYFKPTSGTEYLVAVCGNKVFKVTSFGSSTADITGGLTITGNQNDIWTFVNYNDLCIGVGGAPNAPFKFSGSGNAALLGGSPPSGTACFQMRDRVFIINGSTVYWCVLANPEDWSGTGAGTNAAVTNDGDNLVAGISLNNSTALLFKNYSIHQLTVESSPFPITPLFTGYGACGKRAVIRGPEGLIYFITNEPRMRATDGYNMIEFPNKINDIWNGLNKSRLPYIQGVYVPVYNQIHWYCSSANSNTNDLCIIWDCTYKCWLRCTTGFKANAVTVADGSRVFCGHYDGNLYEKMKSGVLNDASETAPGIINAYWRFPWINNGSNMSVKHPRYMDISFETQVTTGGTIGYSYGFDFSADKMTGYISQAGSGGTWDTDTWDDTFAWGGNSSDQKRVWLYGRGNNFQPVIFNRAENETMSINSIDIAIKEQGVKVIGNP